MSREIVVEYVWATDLGNAPEDACEFVEWVNGFLDRFPPQRRAEAKVNCYVDDDDDCCISFYYERPETDEEMSSRLERERENERGQESSDKQHMLSLIAKYGLPESWDEPIRG